jgi:hypothetical protein
MKPAIGFNRHLEMDWLVQTASWSANGVHGQALKNKIDVLLAPALTVKLPKTKPEICSLGFGIRNQSPYPKHFMTMLVDCLLSTVR